MVSKNTYHSLFSLQQRDHPAVHFDHFIILHFFDLAHHGTAVDAEIICQLQQGEGQLKGQAVLLGGLDAEIAHELPADGTVAEDVHFFCQVNDLACHQLQHVFHYLCMVLAGIGAAFGDMAFFNKQNGAILFADGDKFILLIGKGKSIPENAGIFQILQKIQRTVDGDTADRNRPFQQQTDIFFFSVCGRYDVFFGERTLFHIKAGDHFFDAFGGNILKQRVFRNIFHNLLLSVAFATTITLKPMIS